ncbi:hypothetical protein NicSoilB4_15750 [Arthrobacter sp. NicSoilB4]|uniref:SRPBCC family protein n=1 Tax=Arthrobacter sp. NicSoilB4 TaxID=2830997 RepID=UPI001CC81558|nr:SRPBCC family protein [Arthrobacter sp. NicSoilB4]BCW66812.1 hypothetical protein NicSoilB4_15750 [Arthrobacter sp. NicSoilB4]
MKSYEAKTLINARKSTVWDIITDGGNYTVWDSGITHISGGLRNGGTIRVRSRTGGNRTFRLRVRQMPGEAMTWTRRLALGLFKGVCTFTLTSHGEKTLLHVRQDLAGPLLGLLWKTLPDIEQAFAEYVNAVKKRAELLSRHEARIHASQGRPQDVSGERSDQPSARDTPPWSRTLLPHDQRWPQPLRLQQDPSKSSW